MRFFKSYIESHQFKFLPAFSCFLLKHHLEALLQEQLQLSREVKLPLLSVFKDISDEQLLDISRAPLIELLTNLSENRAGEQIENALEKWKKDQLGVIGQFELIAEDITLINYVRGKAFRKFIPLFTTDAETILTLIDELDSFLAGAVTAATNAYILLLKERIARHEQELLEAQRIACIGSYEMDLETYRTRCSPQLYRIYEIEEGAGFHSFMRFIHPADRQKVENCLADAFTKGEFEMEFRFLKGAKTKYIWSRGITDFGKGTKGTLIGTVQDITSRKRAELELTEKTTALQRSNESLEQFAFAASHDLQEPIRKISIFTDMVLNQEPSLCPLSQTHLKRVRALAQYTRGLVSNVLEYATLSGKEPKQYYDLNSIVQEAASCLQPFLKEKKATISYGALPRIKVIPSQFRKLFQTIFSNALKFSLPGKPPLIAVNCQWLSRDEVNGMSVLPADRYLKVSVSDNGIGFDQRNAEKVFSLFYRLHSKSDYEGSGLGLAIAKRILDNHGGIIYAQSLPGKGTIISFIFPQ